MQVRYYKIDMREKWLRESYTLVGHKVSTNSFIGGNILEEMGQEGR